MNSFLPDLKPVALFDETRVQLFSSGALSEEDNDATLFLSSSVIGGPLECRVTRRALLALDPSARSGAEDHNEEKIRVFISIPPLRTGGATPINRQLLRQLLSCQEGGVLLSHVVLREKMMEQLSHREDFASSLQKLASQLPPRELNKFMIGFHTHILSHLNRYAQGSCVRTDIRTIKTGRIASIDEVAGVVLKQLRLVTISRRGDLSGIYRKNHLSDGGEKHVSKLTCIYGPASLDRQLVLAVAKDTESGRQKSDRFRKSEQRMVALHQLFAQLRATGAPYIVREELSSHMTSGGSVQLASLMECGELGSLSSFDPQQYPMDIRMDVIAQIGKALQDLHSKGLRHGDLNLSNVVLTQTGGRLSCRLIDFGIIPEGLGPCRFFPQVTFLPPEVAFVIQRTGGGFDKPLTSEVDMWLAGDICLYLRTGRSVIGRCAISCLREASEREICSLFDQVESDVNALLGQSHDPFDRLLMRLFSKRPEDRPSAADLLRGTEEWFIRQTPPVEVVPSCTENDIGCILS